MVATALDLDEYRSHVEEYFRRPGPAADERFAQLFSADVVAALEALAAAGGPRPWGLARFAVEGHLRLSSAAEIARIEEELRLPLTEGLTLLDVDMALAAEPDPERRRELQRERLRAIGNRLGSAIADAVGLRAAAAQALGAASPAVLIARVGGLDLRAAAALGLGVLDAGDGETGPALDRVAREALGVPLSALDAADLPRLLRAPHLEDALPPAGAHAALERTCELLGMEAPPRVASSGATGLAAYAEALRIGGLTLARAGASARLPVEARRLGDPAVAQATAFLLEGLLGEPAWLVRVMGVGDPGRIAAAARALRMLAARAAAARAVALEGGSAEDLMSRAIGVEWPPELTLADPLAGAAAADAIRGRALAALLRAHMHETSGDRWFADPRAAELLREVWVEGGDLTPEGLAVELGSRGLDAEDVAAETA